VAKGLAGMNLRQLAAGGPAEVTRRFERRAVAPLLRLGDGPRHVPRALPGPCIDGNASCCGAMSSPCSFVIGYRGELDNGLPRIRRLMGSRRIAAPIEHLDLRGDVAGCVDCVADNPAGGFGRGHGELGGLCVLEARDQLETQRLARPDPELAEDAFRMGPHGVGADAQLRGDLLV
jgi:hypothetical protein